MSVAALLFLALVTALLVAVTRLIPWRFRQGRAWMLIGPKMLMPVLVWPALWVGTLCAGGSLLLARLFWRAAGGAWNGGVLAALLVAAGAAYAALASAGYIRRVTAPHRGFEQAFGPAWQAGVPAAVTAKMVRRRWSPLGFGAAPVRVERDIAYWTLPSTEQQLLADLWLPPEGVQPSGLAFLFFHGSAWHFGQKGVGMDPTFRHLAAQGHVLMDADYRLAPAVEIIEMVGDVKRAVAWMKRNAGRYGVDPGRIVVGGASAGGHISLLAAYADGDGELTPVELAGADTRVAGVVSYYGPVDMRAYVEHEAGRLGRTGQRVTTRRPIDFAKGLPTEQAMFNLMGGMPDDVPAIYDLAAVATHVTPGGPPALILQGEFDFITQAGAVRRLVGRLQEAGIPVVYQEFPQTDHAWDVMTAMGAATGFTLPLPDSQYSPPSMAALHDLERFLACIAARGG